MRIPKAVENGMLDYKEEPEAKLYSCPHCGTYQFSYLYKQDGEVIGCTECVSSVDLWEVQDD